MADADLLAAADKAFAADIAAMDAESVASAKEVSNRFSELSSKFTAKVSDVINSPLRFDDVNGQSDDGSAAKSAAAAENG